MRRIVLGMIVTGLLAPAADAASVNTSPAGLQVFDSNVENLQLPGFAADPHRSTPKGTNWCYANGVDHPEPALGKMTVAPDILTIQQLDGKGPEGPHRQLDRFLAALQERFGERYNAIVALKKPRRQPLESTQPKGCPSKTSQTNAVIYRMSRLDYVEKSKTRFLSFGNKRAKAEKRCTTLSRSSRTVNVLARFRDKLTQRRVTAASFHWPTKESACPRQNALVLQSALKVPDSDLVIAGGDANTHATATSKWAIGLALGGYRSVPPSAKAIDYLFARRAAGQPAAWTNAATVGYGSDHPAVMGFVSY